MRRISVTDSAETLGVCEKGNTGAWVVVLLVKITLALGKLFVGLVGARGILVVF